jgi:hypothetical protein
MLTPAAYDAEKESVFRRRIPHTLGQIGRGFLHFFEHAGNIVYFKQIMPETLIAAITLRV